MFKIKWVKEIDIKDVFFFVGLSLLGTGIWWIYPPASLITVGILLTWLGWGGGKA